MHWGLKFKKNFSKIHFMREAAVKVIIEVEDNCQGKNITIVIRVDNRLVEKQDYLFEKVAYCMELNWFL